MSGLSLPLQPNTVYAYTFAKAPGAAGYENLASVAGGTYAGGQAVLIPQNSGQIFTSSTNGWNGTFDLGISLAVPSTTLSATKIVGGQIQLQWSQGILLEATNLTGPWTTNVNTSPYTVTPSGPKKFYRLKLQ
jgi:hypothetical protein